MLYPGHTQTETRRAGIGSTPGAEFEVVDSTGRSDYRHSESDKPL